MDGTTSPARTSLAIALVGAPVLWLGAEAFSPALKSDTGAQLAVIAAHGERWYAYTLLLLLGTVLFVPALAGIARVSRSASPRLSTIGTALVGYGTVIAVGDVMSQFLVWKAAGAGLDRAQMVELLGRVDDAPGVGLVFATGGLSFLVGSVLLSVTLARASTVPTWAGVAFGVAMFLQLVGFTASSVPLIAFSAVVALVALAPVARAVAGAPQPAPVG
jgi:hypothetical protein